jgi:hypothetical protein
MLQGISNTIASLPVASIGCTAAGLYIGRKWCAAGIYKAGGIGANLIGSKSAAAWNQVSDEYIKIAKKDGFRDLTAATGLIVLGLASGFTKEKIPEKEESISNFPFRAVGISLFVGYLFGGCSVFDYMHKENDAMITNYNTVLRNVLKK